MKLTEKQKRFVDYYIETGSSVEAARRAGYKHPKVQGPRLLAKVRPFVEERLKKLEDERIASAEEVLRLLTSAARGEMDEEVVVVVGNGKNARVVKERRQISPRDRIKAAELLGKRYLLFSENVNLTANVGVQIIDDIGSDADDDTDDKAD